MSADSRRTNVPQEATPRVPRSLVAVGRTSVRSNSDASAIIAVWVAPVEAVLAVVGAGPAWAPVEPARSCDAPRPQSSAATLGPSLDDLICPQQQRGRDREAEGLD